MSYILGAVFLFFGVVALSITGGYITKATSDISNIPNYKDNDHLSRGHTDGVWASILTWLTVASIIALGILYLVFTSKKQMGVIDLVVIYILFFISLVGILIVTILSIATAANISAANVTDDKGSHSAATIAAVLGSLSFVIIVVALVLIIVFKVKKLKTTALSITKMTGEPEREAPKLPEEVPVGVPGSALENAPVSAISEAVAEESVKEAVRPGVETRETQLEGFVPIQTKSGGTVLYNREMGKQNARRIGQQFGINVPDWLYDLGERAVLQYLKTQ